MKGFQASLPAPVLQVVSTILKSGYECHIVGGALRDYLLNRTVKDYDIASSATPEQVKKLFRRVLPIGQGHGTVTVIVKGYQIEVTTFRSSSSSEMMTTPGIREDLFCRDFTINAISWTLGPLGKGSLFDPFGGALDMENRILRMIGGREENLSDDPLRILRGCRFVAACNLSVEAQTFSAMKKFSHLISGCAVERIFAEIIKILTLETPSLGLELLFSSGLVNTVLAVDGTFNLPPSFDETRLFNAVDMVLEPVKGGSDVLNDSVFPLSDSGIILVRLAIFLQSIFTWGEARRWLLSMRAPKEMISKLGLLFEVAAIEPEQIVTDVDVRKFFSTFDQAMFGEYIAFWRGTGHCNYTSFVRVAREELLKNPCISIRDLAVDGKLLMTNLNIEPGVHIGRILNSLLESVIEDPSKNDREFLLKMALRLYNNVI